MTALIGMLNKFNDKKNENETKIRIKSGYVNNSHMGKVVLQDSVLVD